MKKIIQKITIVRNGTCDLHIDWWSQQSIWRSQQRVCSELDWWSQEEIKSILGKLAKEHKRCHKISLRPPVWTSFSFLKAGF
jgi:hypothetical protein